MSISTDILLSCSDENRRGGIKRIFVIDRDSVTSLTADGSNHSYSAITLEATDDKFYEIEGELETKLFNSEGSRENGSISYDTSLEVFVPKMDKVKAAGINSYVESCKLIIIFETYNKATSENKAFVMGYDEIMGKDASVHAMASEVLEAELQGQNGYTVSFAGKQAQLLREFVGDIETNGGTVSLGS